MYLGSFSIDDVCTFTVNTFAPDGSGESDADDFPTYRIYEDETGTPILTGTMAKLDDAGTVGFYSEQITLSAANGFENGKSYSIRARAVVSGIPGVIIRTLQIGETLLRRIYAKAALIGTVGATLGTNDLEAGEFQVVIGDTYSQTLGNEIELTSGPDFPDPTGKTLTLGIGRLDSDTDLFTETGRLVSWDSGTGVIVAAFPVSLAHSNDLDADVDQGRYGYSWEVDYGSGAERTGGYGECIAVRKYTNS